MNDDEIEVIEDCGSVEVSFPASYLTEHRLEVVGRAVDLANDKIERPSVLVMLTEAWVRDGRLTLRFCGRERLF